ncbi:MAG: DUF2914 domain-containing protein [candidate division KSB1 bacterium]|nr:DUF2914 domain-containing protein [candidate division KSB1 bacterium]
MLAKPINSIPQKAQAVRRAYHDSVQKGRAFFHRKKQAAKSFYERYQKYFPLIAFIIGFLYDSLTLTRIDLLLDNLILLGYTVGAGMLIAVLGLAERGRIRQAWIVKHLDWVVTITHFFLGGLLSSYVVFYFKSAAVGKTFIFVGLLVVLMLANEFFSHRLRNLKLLCSIYFFCAFAFLTFFLPVMTHKMSAAMFISSGLLSFLLTSAIVAAIYHGGIRQARRELIGMVWPPVVIFAALLIFYFQNWMPPVPLALKEEGIYRRVKRVGENYEVRYAKPRWWQFWKDDESTFAYSPGDTVYCFAAIFAPTALQERIEHHWQTQNSRGKWLTTDKVGYPIVGGRDGGWRGYTFKRNLSAGDWRIEVKTSEGRLLGRIPLKVVPVEKRPRAFTIEYR